MEFEVICTAGYTGFGCCFETYLSFTKDKCYKVKNGYIYDDLYNKLYIGSLAKCAKDVVFAFHETGTICSIDFEDVSNSFIYVVCVKAHVSNLYNTFFTSEKHYKIYNTRTEKYILDDRLNKHRVFMQYDGLYVTGDRVDGSCFEVIDKEEEKEDLQWNTDMTPTFKRVDYFDKENVGPTPRRSGRCPWVEEWIEEDYETYYVDNKPFHVHTGRGLGKLLTDNSYRSHECFTLSKEDIDYIKMDEEIVKNMMELFETSYKKICFGVREVPEIEDVKFNGPATIVFWADGTKTVVKCQEGDTFDPEKGLTMAIAKKLYGNKSSYCNKLKKWLPEEKKEEVEKPNFLSKNSLKICTENGESKKPTIDDLRDMFREVVGEKECYGGIDKKCD